MIDPRNGKIFYIGFTEYLNRRYKVHLNVNGKRREKNLYKDNVIRNILKSGLKPQIIILDSCEKIFDEKIKKFKHEILEQEYIKAYKDKGINLTNLTIGGDGGCTYQRKVYQYDEMGNFLCEYESVNELANKYCVKPFVISKAINQRVKKSYRGTYLFNDNENINKFQFRKIKKNNISIQQYTKDNILIKEFKSQKEASIITNIHQPNINHCLMNRRKYAGGYVWKYKNN